MSGSSYGTIFRLTTFGESHGPALGVILDGVPAGLSLHEDDIQPYLNRRKPGQNPFTTPRKEGDRVTILSGVFQGLTTGTPLTMVVENHNQRGSDYEHLKDIFRPGHADYGFQMKYGHRDYKGGGRSSGRETLGRVCAGAVAVKILETLGITVTAYTKSIGPFHVAPEDIHPEDIFSNPFYMPNSAVAEQVKDYISGLMEKKDSAGGVVECIVTNLPPGLGEPVFDKLDAQIGKALFSIGGVKGVEFGSGMQAAEMTGSTHNDSFVMSDAGLTKKTNHAGGILGGLSDGSPLVVRAAFKPTPSIGQPQQTVTADLQNTSIEIKGRHDPLIVPRAVVVAESMVAVTLVDILFQNMTAVMSKVTDFYQK